MEQQPGLPQFQQLENHHQADIACAYQPTGFNLHLSLQPRHCLVPSTPIASLSPTSAPYAMKKSIVPMKPSSVEPSVDKICTLDVSRRGEHVWTERPPLPVFIAEHCGSMSGKTKERCKICEIFSFLMLLLQIRGCLSDI